MNAIIVARGRFSCCSSEANVTREDATWRNDKEKHNVRLKIENPMSSGDNEKIKVTGRKQLRGTWRHIDSYMYSF